jgi:hypothetical protein
MSEYELTNNLKNAYKLYMNTLDLLSIIHKREHVNVKTVYCGKELFETFTSIHSKTKYNNVTLILDEDRDLYSFGFTKTTDLKQNTDEFFENDN